MLLRLSESADILYSSWSAGYRPDGLRGSKTASSTTTYFLYDGATPVAELNSSGTITALNVFGADGLIGRVVPGGTDIQYLFDHQGNVAQRLDGSGSVISKSTYDAYGAESSTSTPTDPFGYNAQSGYYFDRETGLYLCTFRYYDPAKGRWINRDPIGYAGGMNLYGYCGGGPVGGVDASGLQRVTWLYRLFDEVGNFLKWGITRNPLTRHPSKFDLEIIAKYEDNLPKGRNVPMNRHALDDERALTSMDGGPLNNERWSSSRSAGCALGLSIMTLDPIGFGESLGPFIQPYVDDAHDGLQETRINRWLGKFDEYTDFLNPRVPRALRR